MAQQIEAMDVDDIDCDFDNKENTCNQTNLLPKAPSTEKGYEELDVSELNMKLRYSFTPNSSMMSKSFTANCTDNQDSESPSNVVSLENSTLTQSLNSTLTINNLSIKQSKPPLQEITPLQSLESTLNVDGKNITVTVTDIDENLSLPSMPSSTSHTPESVTPTQDIPKGDGGSPIMRGLKSVLNMFRSSQSPIPTEEESKSIDQEAISPALISSPSDKHSEDRVKALLASTPIAAKSKDQNSSKRNSPLRDSVIFNDNLETELEWKDETTIIFSEEKIPLHKLFYQKTKPSDRTNVNEKKNIDKLDDTVEYMELSYSDSTLKDKTMHDNELSGKMPASKVESDSEFLDCESTFTKNESEMEKIINDLNDTTDVEAGLSTIQGNEVNEDVCQTTVGVPNAKSIDNDSFNNNANKNLINYVDSQNFESGENTATIVIQNVTDETNLNETRFMETQILNYQAKSISNEVAVNNEQIDVLNDKTICNEMDINFDHKKVYSPKNNEKINKIDKVEREMVEPSKVAIESINNDSTNNTPIKKENVTVSTDDANKNTESTYKTAINVENETMAKQLQECEHDLKEKNQAIKDTINSTMSISNIKEVTFKELSSKIDCHLTEGTETEKLFTISKSKELSADYCINNTNEISDLKEKNPENVPIAYPQNLNKNVFAFDLVESKELKQDNKYDETKQQCSVLLQQTQQNEDKTIAEHCEETKQVDKSDLIDTSSIESSVQIKKNETPFNDDLKPNVNHELIEGIHCKNTNIFVLAGVSNENPKEKRVFPVTNVDVDKNITELDDLQNNKPISVFTETKQEIERNDVVKDCGDENIMDLKKAENKELIKELCTNDMRDLVSSELNKESKVFLNANICSKYILNIEQKQNCDNLNNTCGDHISDQFTLDANTIGENVIISNESSKNMEVDINVEIDKEHLDDPTEQVNTNSEGYNDNKLPIQETNLQMQTAISNSKEILEKHDEEIILSENDSPYVSLNVTVEDVIKRADENMEEIKKPLTSEAEIKIASPSSPKIQSKGYNFNFDEIDDPFATKINIRMSPPPGGASPNQSLGCISSETKKYTPNKVSNINKNKRKSYPERKKFDVKNEKLNKTVSIDVNEVNKGSSVIKMKTQTVNDTTVLNEEVLSQEKSLDHTELAVNSSPVILQPVVPPNANEISLVPSTENVSENVIQKTMSNEDVVSNENDTQEDVLTDIKNKTVAEVIEENIASMEQSTYSSAGTSSKEDIEPKSVFNLPEFDNADLLPSALKSMMSLSPPLPISTHGEADSEFLNTNNAHYKESPNDETVSNSSMSSSIKATSEKFVTVKEVNTEDEDTIEGPFLEAEDINIDQPQVDFCGRPSDMIHFTDLPPRENVYNTEAGEMFIDADAFEFLMNQNQTADVGDCGKESLFIKFDPLYARSLTADGNAAALSKAHKKQSTPKKKMENLPSPSSSKLNPAQESFVLTKSENNHSTFMEQNFEEINVTVPKPMMVVTPAVNPVATPRLNATTPTRSTRRSVASPAIAAIDRLLSLSAANSPAVDTTTTHINQEQQEAELALIQLREILADKEEHVYYLRTETKELKERLSVLESQMRSLEAESEERLQKINELNEKLTEKSKINKSLALVVEQYERTISSLIAEKEQDKLRHAEERLKLIKERDEQTAHLASMEVSFNDLHSKYEKSKQIILNYKANEDGYKKSLTEFDENLTKMQNNYELLKQHATSKLNHANQELEKMNRAHEAEVLKFNALIKRKELHVKSLEESLAQKTKANEELTAICDELINKVG